MPRWFNVAGPCNPNIHYMLAPLARIPAVMPLIEQQSYFVIHAPRQTGKTTAMIALARALTAAGRFAAVLLSAEVGAAFNDDPGAAELAILNSWRRATAFFLPAELRPPPWPSAEPGTRLAAALDAWAQASPRPLVIFLDEIDALQNEALVAVLRQLREGYFRRPEFFPWSLALIGLRDVRDYKVASGGSERLHTASPFNIKTRSLSLTDFTAKDVAALYQQHTDDTGQVFTPEATALAFELTQGQPWLVNALAKVTVEDLLPDPTMPITAEVMEQAKEILIERQDTHLDSLAERLLECNQLSGQIEHLLEILTRTEGQKIVTPSPRRDVCRLVSCPVPAQGVCSVVWSLRTGRFHRSGSLHRHETPQHLRACKRITSRDLRRIPVILPEVILLQAR